MLQKWGLLSKQNNNSSTAYEEAYSNCESPTSVPTKRPRSTTNTNAAASSSSALKPSTTANGGTDAGTTGNILRLDSYHAQLYGAEVDPVGFSYFLAANMPISNERLQSLVEAQDVIDRLRSVCVINVRF